MSSLTPRLLKKFLYALYNMVDDRIGLPKKANEIEIIQEVIDEFETTFSEHLDDE